VSADNKTMAWDEAEAVAGFRLGPWYVGVDQISAGKGEVVRGRVGWSGDLRRGRLVQQPTSDGRALDLVRAPADPATRRPEHNGGPDGKCRPRGGTTSYVGRRRLGRHGTDSDGFRLFGVPGVLAEQA